MDFGNILDSSKSLGNIVVSSAKYTIFLDTVLWLRQVESLFLDAVNIVSVSPATEMIPDFAIDACHIRPPHKRTTPNIDSAVGPRGN